MAKVVTINETNAYVKLLEYNEIDGMIPLSELSRLRIRSISQFLRVGTLEVVQVLTVDEHRGYIDLSKRRVSEDEVTTCKDRYNKAKLVHLIMRQVYGACKETIPTLEALYSCTAWPLADRYGTAYDGLKAFIREPEKVQADVFAASGAAPEAVAALLEQAKRRLRAQPLKLAAKFDVVCAVSAGIDAVREALVQAESEAPPDLCVKIKLVPPSYSVTCAAVDKDVGVRALLQTMERAQAHFKARVAKAEPENMRFLCSFKVTQAPRTIMDEDLTGGGDRDDEEEDESGDGGDESGEEGGEGELPEGGLAAPAS